MKNDPILIEGLPSVSWGEGFYSFGVQTKNSDKPLQCRNQSDLSDLLLIEPIRFILSTECVSKLSKKSQHFIFIQLASLKSKKQKLDSMKFFQRGKNKFNKVDCFNILKSWKVFKMSQMNGWFGMSKF